MASFLQEIKRRKVFQAAAVYILIAWVIIQVIDVVAEPLSLPDWFDTVVIVLLIAGLPVALVLSWALDLTSKGIVWDGENAESAESAEFGAKTIRVAVLPNSVAVLPFETLSSNPDEAYFAAGVHDEVLNQLSKVEDMIVIARTSVMQYQGARRAVSEIAGELRVGMIIEGTVRYAGDRVRVTAQLIHPATGAHLWSETYDSGLTDVFTAQTDIATRISKNVQAVSGRLAET